METVTKDVNKTTILVLCERSLATEAKYRLRLYDNRIIICIFECESLRLERRIEISILHFELSDLLPLSCGSR